MKIAVVNWSSRRVGGAEAYLGEVVPELLRAGHEVGFFYEIDAPSDREPIPLSDSVPVWSVEDSGPRAALDALWGWKPDIVFVHKVESPSVEASLLSIASSVFFAHDYYGACVSGLKTFKFPRPTPCHRRFGPACLALYFPRRCGGRSPVTMLRLYALQARRLAALRRYDALVTYTEHMRREYLRAGFHPDRVHNISAETPASPDPGFHRVARERRPGAPWRLLFLGRMDHLKGGHYLVAALRLLAAGFREPIWMTMAGDGPARRDWEEMARRLLGGHPTVRVTFPGWIPAGGRSSLFAETDLLVMPSLWPEPFGRAGPEAGQHGIPAVAYDVGGIGEWLEEGVNGHLAPGTPPTPLGLAEALRLVLEHPESYQRLSAGAVAESRRFSMASHVSALTRLFATLTKQAVP